MSEAATTVRSSDHEHGYAGPTDAMAELARLVGQQDPFSRPAEPIVPPPLAAEADFAAFDSQFGTDATIPRRLDPSLARNPAADDAWERARLRYPSLSVDRRPEPSPDAWVQGAEPADAPEVAAPTREPATADVGGSKRTLIVLAAVVALTGGGLAASFLAKPSASASASTGGGTPTILAATGPVKVQPQTQPTGTDAPSQPSTLLDKNNNDGTATARVVNTVEQPIDLGQAIKPSAAETTASNSPFPEPRKVKTVLVRPDGSIIASSSAAAPAPVPPGSDQASLAFDPKTALPIVTPPPSAAAVPTAASPPAATTPRPAPTPKTTARATTTKPPVADTAAAEPATPVHGPKAKPAVVADAAPTATTPTSAGETASLGAFSVQLGAAASEAEGQSTAGRLAHKYGLSSKPMVVKAEAGGKTVYRIRVAHLTQESAAALCSKVKAAGGGCFAFRN